jgi:HAMP domain-containing protein
MDGSPSDAEKPTGQPKRRLKNFVLDPKFQLKFTSLVVGATVVVATLFGGFLWSTTKRLFVETAAAVEARSKAAETSRDLGSAALNNELLKRFDDPTFVAQLKEQSKAIDEQYENESKAIVAQRSKLIEQQRAMLLSLVGGICAMVLFIALFSIVATHKIVGPLYRLKRLTQSVAAGVISEPPPHSREGDEFKHLFEEFVRMVQALRVHQSQELVAVENLIERAERTGVSPEVLRLLKTLAEKMRSRLEAR